MELLHLQSLKQCFPLLLDTMAQKPKKRENTPKWVRNSNSLWMEITMAITLFWFCRLILSKKQLDRATNAKMKVTWF